MGGLLGILPGRPSVTTGPGLDGALVGVFLGFDAPSTLLAPAWVDFSSRVREAPKINIQRGRSSELSQFSAGSCTVVLADVDGAFSIGGAYYDSLVPGRTQILVRARLGNASYVLFRGFVESAVPDYQAGDAVVVITAVDAIGILARRSPGSSAYAALIDSMMPKAWYRFGEAGGTALVNSARNGVNGAYANPAWVQGLVFGDADTALDCTTGLVSASFDESSDLTGVPYTVQVRIKTASVADWNNSGLVVQTDKWGLVLGIDRCLSLVDTFQTDPVSQGATAYVGSGDQTATFTFVRTEGAVRMWKDTVEVPVHDTGQRLTAGITDRLIGTGPTPVAAVLVDDTNGTTTTLSAPAGLAKNDVLVVGVWSNAAGAISIPDFSVIYTSTAGGADQFAILQRWPVTGAEPASWTITHSGSRLAWVCGCYRGVNTALLSVGLSAAGPSATPTLPSAGAMTMAGIREVGFAGSDAGAATPIPAGTTARDATHATDASISLWDIIDNVGVIPARGITAADATGMLFQTLYIPSAVGNPFTGVVDEVVWWDRALSDEEVLATVNAELTGLTATTGEVANFALDAVGWPAELRDIDEGLFTMGPVAFSGKSATDVLQSCANTEGGRFFISADGLVVLRQADSVHLRSTEGTVQAHYTGDGGGGLPYEKVTPDHSLSLFRNEFRITRNGGLEQVVNLAGPDDDVFSLSISTESATDADARALAEIMAQRFGLNEDGDPLPRRRFTALDITLRADTAALFPHVAGDELGTRVQVDVHAIEAAGTAVTEVLLDAVSHAISAAEWRTSYSLNSAEAEDLFT